MNHTGLWALAAAAALGLSSNAVAQSETSAPLPVPSTRADDAVDGVRVRGGFSINGGLGFYTDQTASISGPIAGLAARLGIQFNHLLSLLYQNMPQLFILTGGGGGAVTFLDYNSLLLNLTIADVFEIGAGPSFDYAAIATLTGLGVTSTSATGFGLHGRAAFIVGGRHAGSARRSGFTIGVDAHPFFFEGGNIVMLTVGVGADWY